MIDDVQKYLENNGTICPCCGGQDIVPISHFDLTNNYIHRKIKCGQCLSIWYDMYELIGFRNLIKGEECVD